jgi:hexosaminidase
MWTERVPDKTTLDQRVFPRMIGLSEVLWTNETNRNFEEFYGRLQTHYPILKAFGINYGLEAIGAKIELDFSDNDILIKLKSNLANLSLKYCWNGDTDWADYEEPIVLNNSGLLFVQAFKGEDKYGPVVTQSFVAHKGLNAAVEYSTEYSEWYEGNRTKNLVDGRLGSLDFRDGNWQGFWGDDMSIVIQLEKAIDVRNVRMNFYQYANSWIFVPKTVRIYLGGDGENWKAVIQQETGPLVDLTNTKSIQEVEFKGINADLVKFIKIEAKNVGKVPDGHEAAGSDAWIFIDEIIIE